VAAAKKFLLKERRRSARIEGRVPVGLALRRGRQGPLVAGPSPGEILDVSSYGAGLLVEQIRVDNCHLFYSPQDNPAYILHLEFVPAPDEEPLSIPVRPVRFDRFLEDEAAACKPFQIGVEFMLESNDEKVRLLYKLVAEQSGVKGWWRKIVESILPS